MSMLRRRRQIQELEAALVHPERQLPLLLRVHDRQGAARYHPSREHLGARGNGQTQAVLSGALRLGNGLHQGLQD